jgi:hypothetical protein
MTEEHWARFDPSDPESVPLQISTWVVETERGPAFDARFIQENTDFSLVMRFGESGSSHSAEIPKEGSASLR